MWKRKVGYKHEGFQLSFHFAHIVVSMHHKNIIPIGYIIAMKELIEEGNSFALLLWLLY